MGSLPAVDVCWQPSVSQSRGTVPKERQAEYMLTRFGNGDSQDGED